MKLRQLIAAALMDVDAAEMDEDEAVEHLVMGVKTWLYEEGVTERIHNTLGQIVHRPVVRAIVDGLVLEAEKK